MWYRSCHAYEVTLCAQEELWRSFDYNDKKVHMALLLLSRPLALLMTARHSNKEEEKRRKKKSKKKRGKRKDKSAGEDEEKASTRQEGWWFMDVYYQFIRPCVREQYTLLGAYSLPSVYSLSSESHWYIINATPPKSSLQKRSIFYICPNVNTHCDTCPWILGCKLDGTEVPVLASTLAGFVVDDGGGKESTISSSIHTHRSRRWWSHCGGDSKGLIGIQLWFSSVRFGLRRRVVYRNIPFMNCYSLIHLIFLNS